MKRFSVAINRYRAKKTEAVTQQSKQGTREIVPRAYKKVQKNNNICTIDDKTILYICNQYIQSEYGRRGSTTLHAVRYVGSVVVVTVESALWAQEIWTHRELMTTHINRLCGEGVVTKIIAEVR